MQWAEFILPRFSSPEALHAFRVKNDASKYVSRRFFMYLGALIYGGYAILDVWVGGEVTGALLYFRVSGVLGMLACAVMFHTKHRGGFSDATLITLYLGVGALGVIGMTMVADGVVATLYPLGLIVVLAFGGTILAPPFRHAVALTASIFVVYWVSTIWSRPQQDALPIIGFFLTVGYLSAAFGALFRERLERLQALAQTELEEINARLEASRREAVRARDEALEARQTQSQFIANMSHELRTPLNAINGFSEVMMRQALGPLPEIYLGYAKDIHDSGRNLLRNVNDLLDINRLKSGKMSWEEERFSLDDLIRQAVAMCQPDAEAAKVRVVCTDYRLGVEFQADRTRMTQAVTNLITNAIKFSSAGGRVTVAALMRPGQGCEITVSDTGIGISAEDLKRIGRPFEQAEDGTVAKKKGGLGLGLSIVKGILENAGGRLEIESKLGVGTVTRIVLPESRMHRLAQPHVAIVA